MEARSSVAATIKSGLSVSNVIDCNNRSVVGIVAPAAWTAAALSIEVSCNEVVWVASLVGSENTASGTWPSVIAGAGYIPDLASMIPWRYVRLRSGTMASPVSQLSDRSFTLVTRPLA